MNLTSWFNFYFIIMITSLSTSNWLSMWTMLEITTWVMLILSISDEMEFSSMFKMYFMFSMISIILMVMWLTNIMKHQWILLLFSLKMAIPPCHWWLSWIMKNMKWKMMWWFTTIHKFLPMMFSTLILNYNILLFWCVMSSIFSAMNSWTSNSTYNIIFFSSCLHTSWMWITTFDTYNFMSYFFIYTLMMWLIFYKMEKWSFFQKDIFLSINMMLMIGLPTSMLFFLKMNISNFLSISHSIMMWMILLSNIFIIYPYTRMTWISINNNMLTMFNPMLKFNTKPIYIFLTLMQFTVWPLLI